MAKRIISSALLLCFVFLLSACNKVDTMKYTFESLQDENLMGGSSYFMDFGEMESQEDAAIAEGLLSACNKGDTMKYTFESLQDENLMGSSSYFMDFGEMESQEDAAIAEGKLLSAFGQPEYTSENYENSFQYMIRATADNGESVILTVYGMGVVHIGAEQQNDFAQKAASALIEYVNAFAPADYSRTVYYLDFDMQIDIQVKGGKATISQSQISQEKANELFDKFYQ